MKRFYLIFILVLFQGLTAAQSRTNLEIFYSLLDSSINSIPSDLTPAGISVYSGNNFLVRNYIFSRLEEKFPHADTLNSELSYAVEDMKLDYGEIFRKKFLGDYYVQRNFLVKGNWVLASENLHKNFIVEFSDSIKYDDIKNAENILHPFTRAELPAEPFFQGILEPVVAVGTAATAVILFFILRSK